jgi:hypothetical protein
MCNILRSQNENDVSHKAFLTVHTFFKLFNSVVLNRFFLFIIFIFYAESICILKAKLAAGSKTSFLE